MKESLLLLTIIIFGLLEITLLDFFRIFGTRPNLLLIVMVIASLTSRYRWAIALSLCAGFLKDTLGTFGFGANTLLFPIWSFLIIKLSQKISVENNSRRIALVLIIAFLHNITSGLILIYLGKGVPAGIFLRIVFVESLYTAIASLLIFNIARRRHWLPR